MIDKPFSTLWKSIVKVHFSAFATCRLTGSSKMVHRFLYLGYRYCAFKKFLSEARNSRSIQLEALLKKIRRNAASSFGQDHGFSEIRTLADFRRRVPVTNYDYYGPYIDRVKRGEAEAMFGPGTKILMFALTSGTTGSSKFIPVTEEFFEEYRRGWNLWGVRMYWDHVDLVRKRKKTVKLGSDWQEFYSEGGIPCGSISGLVAETAPLFLRDVRE